MENFGSDATSNPVWLDNDLAKHLQYVQRARTRRATTRYTPSTRLYPCRLYPLRFVPQFLGHGDHPIRTLDSKELRAQIKRVEAASGFLRSQNRKHSLRIGCTLSGGALLAAFVTLCAAWGLQGSTILCLCSSAATWRTELPLLPMTASALPALPGKRHFSRSGEARPLPCNTLSGASYPRFPILARGNSRACLG